MDVTTCRLAGPVEFLSIGQFVSGPGWRHSRRTMDSFELMFVRRGVLPIRAGEHAMRVGAGEVVLLPRGVEHAGTEAITGDLEFYWLHFRVPDARVVSVASAADLPQDDHDLIIPDRSRIPDPDRVAVLCGQLIDLYARFGPDRNAYCDYSATSLLLEVSAQERSMMTDSSVASLTGGIAGIWPDGRPIRFADAQAAGRWHGGSYAGGEMIVKVPGTVRHDVMRRDVSDHDASGRDASNRDGARHGAPRGGSRSEDAARSMAVPSADGRKPNGFAPMLAVRAWIMANACDDITVAGIAARFHYSPSYLTSMYKRVFGIGVTEQITAYRIDRARDLLSSTASPVADVAREAGYDDPKYFARVFKRRTGLTPRQYRAAFPKRLYNSI